MSEAVTGTADTSVGQQLSNEAAEAVNTGEANQAETRPTEQLEGTQETPNQETPTPPKKYTFKGIKVHDKEIDLEDISEDQVKELLRKGKSAEVSWREAAQIRKEAQQRIAAAQKIEQEKQQMLNEIKADPLKCALSNGADEALIRDATEKWLLSKYEEEQMSPEARRALAAERQLETFKQREAETQKKMQRQQLDQQKKQYAEQYQKAILGAVDGTGLPKSPVVIRRIADVMRMDRARGNQPDATRAAEYVRQEMTGDVASLVGGVTQQINEAHKSKDESTVMNLGSQIENWLGEDFITAVQRYGILKLKSKRPNLPANESVDTAKSLNEPTDDREWTEEEIKEKRKQRALELERMKKYEGAMFA